MHILFKPAGIEKGTTMRNRFFCIATIMVCSSLVLACGNSKDTSKQADRSTEKAVERALAAQGQNAKVSIDGSEQKMSVTIQDENNQQTQVNVTGSGENITWNMSGSDGTMTMKTGAAAKIPDDFPKEVPLYPGMTVEMLMTTPDAGLSVNALSSDPLDAVADFYREQCKSKGWTEQMNMTQSGEEAMVLLVFGRDERILSVTVTKEAEHTRIMLSQTQQ